MHPTLLSILTPLHLTISRAALPVPKVFLYFPMFRQLDQKGATDLAIARWTMLHSITLHDVYLLSSGSIYLGRFAFEPVVFDAPVEIVFDFSNASEVESGLEDSHLRLLFMNFMTKGVTGVGQIGKLVVKVGSERQRELVERGRRMVGGFPVLDAAEVVLVEQ